ncbi:Rv3654c family TadE-like protein [Arthrobacter sp. SLBN-53]|uniref:Rv3654c family TadE-like protein n=1 Tax=Arthrobacter sp. SLBN-53 TaxID=2768412 RepID=UPI00114EDB69|nr:Rv3654c family TadE-like protein [Arthrobacter sp. SLBN-53]TQK29218.1 secretion/DNA translocation related TadE-like protein [Arthrobacter sp. SLBN-53]
MQWRWPSSSGEDGGSATLIASALMVVLLTLTVGVLVLGSAVVARHRAQSGADLAALAGAASVPSGRQSACAAAQAVAESNHVAVVECIVDGLDVAVSVTATTMLPSRSARAEARAGPADSVLSPSGR